MKFMSIFTLILTLASTHAWAASETFKFNYKGANLTDVLQDYSKASGQKFIIDSGLQGKITIINQGNITVEEAFNQLSSALATNGIAISKQGDTMIVNTARTTQRSAIEVVTELPPMRPEKMVTMMFSLKYIGADEVNKQLRILTSKDGELVPYTHSNQLIVSDWVSNLHRIAKIIDQLDRPAKAQASAKKGA